MLLGKKSSLVPKADYVRLAAPCPCCEEREDGKWPPLVIQRPPEQIQILQIPSSPVSEEPFA